MIKEERGKNGTIILLSFTFLFIFLTGLSKNADYDIFLHLTTGRFILETGRINHPVDPFSFTTANPMTVTSWLAAVAFYIIHSIAGMGGLVLVKAAVMTLVFLILYKNMRLITLNRPGEGYIFIIVLVIAAFAVRMRMSVRPYIFEFLLLSVYFYILNMHRFKGKRNLLFILPVLQIIWVNVHPSNILGIALPFIFLFGEGVKHLLNWNPLLERRQLLSLSLVILLIIAASFIGPGGYKAFSFPFTLTEQKTYMEYIGEWQSLRIAHLAGYGFRYTWGFSLLAILAAIAFLHQRKRVDPTEAAVFCLFLFMAIKKIRFIPEFVLITAPIVARGWAEIFSGPRLSHILSYRRIINGGLIVIISAVFYANVLNSKVYAFGLGLRERVFPTGAVDFLMEHDVRGNMYNSLGYGGYLMWRLFPKHKVFIDGRLEEYDEGLYKDYLDAHSNTDTWKRITERYNIDWVILEYSRDYAKKERMPHLVNNPDWALVYWDTVAAVYVKRGSNNDGIIERFEYRYARPNDLDFSYLDGYLFHEREKIGEVVGEFEENLSISPDNEESHMALAYIHYHRGGKERALGELKKAIEINPDIGFAHSSIGELYREMGDARMAEAAYARALEIDPNDEIAVTGMKRLRRLKR